MHIVCVGLATVDLVQRVDRLPGVDAKAEALTAEVAAGGPATNAAITAAALGARVTLVTAVGAHPLGGLIRADTEAYGVTLLDATPLALTPPPLSAVTVLDATGERTIVSRNAGTAEAPVPPGFAELLADADVVLVDGHHPQLALGAARSGRPLLLDAGSWRPVFTDLLPLADVVACSAAFRPPDSALPGAGSAGARSAGAQSAGAQSAGAQSAGAGSVREALRSAGVRRGAITRGSQPVSWWNDDDYGELTVPAVPAVDTAGAGDAFHGALAVALGRGEDLLPALRYAVGIAGIRVRHTGPRSWLRFLPDGPAHLT